MRLRLLLESRPQSTSSITQRPLDREFCRFSPTPVCIALASIICHTGCIRTDPIEPQLTQNSISSASRSVPTQVDAAPHQDVTAQPFMNAEAGRKHFLQQLPGVWSLHGSAQLTYSEADGTSRHENLSFLLMLDLDHSQVVMNWLKLDQPIAHIIADGRTTCYILLPDHTAYLTDDGDLSSAVAEAFHSATGKQAFPLGFDAGDYLLLLGTSVSTPNPKWIAVREKTNDVARPFKGVRISSAANGDTALMSTYSRFDWWSDNIYFPERIFVTTQVHNTRMVFDFHSIEKLDDKHSRYPRFVIDEWLKTYQSLQIVDLRHATPAEKP